LPESLPVEGKVIGYFRPECLLKNGRLGQLADQGCASFFLECVAAGAFEIRIVGILKPGTSITGKWRLQDNR
jgi:hypothetical protein